MREEDGTVNLREELGAEWFRYQEHRDVQIVAGPPYLHILRVCSLDLSVEFCCQVEMDRDGIRSG